MKITESSRVRVWASITLMIGVYVGAVYWVYQLSKGSSQATARLLPLAIGLAVVPLVLVSILGILSMIAKSLRYVSRMQAARVSPEIRETLASVAVGEGDRERLRRLAEQHPRPFEAIFAEFLSTFRGQINSELSILAVEFGLVKRWNQATHSRNFLTQKMAIANLGRIGSPIDPALLRHPLEQTRVEAACAMLASGSTDAPQSVFNMLPEQSLLGQILLAESLRPHAPEICKRYLEDGVCSPDIRRAKASVDLLRAWERWIPMEGFSRLVAEGDLDLRVAALPSLRFTAASEQEAAQEIIDLLQLPDERVHAPAARAAAELNIVSSIPLLLNQMRTGAPVSALAAAQALAGMGEQGRDLLEQEIYSSSRPQYALHALEQSLVAERG